MQNVWNATLMRWVVPHVTNSDGLQKALRYHFAWLRAR